MSRDRKRLAKELQQRAEEQSRLARTLRAKADKYRQRSSDPAADRAMIQHYEAEARTAEREARIAREHARRLRRWW